MSLNKSHLIPIGLIIVLGFFAYANSVQGEFLWDDEILITHNAEIKKVTNVPKLFLPDKRRDDARAYSLYRPMRELSFLSDYALWRLNPAGFHFTNILLHVAAALCLYWTINLIFSNRLLASFASFLFVVHPVHAEAVTYISGRADPLSLTLILTCFALYIRNVKAKKAANYFFIIFFYLLALLSKEGSLVFPALILTYHFAFKSKLDGKAFSSIVFISLAYIFIRIQIAGFSLPHVSGDVGIVNRLPGFFAAITDYLRLLILPFNLHMEYGNPLFNYTDPKVISGLVLTVLLLAYAARERNRNNLIFFSISWFFITLLPVSNLYPFNAYMAEHWLYIPSIGFFLIVSQGLTYLYNKKKFKNITITAAALLVIFYLSLTVKQNKYWQNPIALFQRTIKYAQDSPRLYNDLGVAYMRRGNNENAISSFNKAIELAPNSVTNAYYNMALVYIRTGRTENALSTLRQGVINCPNAAYLHSAFAVMLAENGRLREAIKEAKRAIELDVYNPIFYYNTGLVYEHNELGIRYGKGADLRKAGDNYLSALEIAPDYEDARRNLEFLQANFLDKNK